MLIVRNTIYCGNFENSATDAFMVYCRARPCSVCPLSICDNKYDISDISMANGLFMFLSDEESL